MVSPISSTNDNTRSDAVIVFGGTGFIGTHLLQRLSEDTPQARLISVDIVDPASPVAGVTYLKHDIRQPIPNDLIPVTRAKIFNLAAVHTTPGHQDWEYYWTNVLGAAHICRFASQIHAQSIVFTSSISVYGQSEDPKDENAEPQPESAYGRSKLLAEQVHQTWLAEAQNRQLTIVRPAVIYGHAEHGNFTRLAQLLQKKRFVYPGRKDTIKSCGYVKDLVSSMLFMSGPSKGNAIYNFCHPERYTSADICDAFCDVAGYRKPWGVIPMELMMLGAFGFECLTKIGIKTSINRSRIQKLFYSTNILPKRLQDAGFNYGYDLKKALKDWSKASGGREFA